jgi:hypothetical protein
VDVSLPASNTIFRIAGYPNNNYIFHDPWMRGVDWIVIGGESGPRARLLDLAWVQSVVGQCRAAVVACFVKQDSGRRPGLQGRLPDDLWAVKQFPR